jgi:hypothetical protein
MKIGVYLLYNGPNSANMKKAKLFSKSLMFLMIIVGLVHQSCYKEEYSLDDYTLNFEINPEFVLPIGYGSLKITDIVKQSDSVLYNGDSIEIHFVEDTIVSFSSEDFFNMPQQTNDDVVFNLGIRTAKNDTGVTSLPLDTLFPGTFTGVANGTSIAFPAFSNLTGSFSLDSLTSFDWVEIETGTLKMEIQNNLPVTVTQLEINLRNLDDNSLIGNFVFSNIASGATGSDEEDLDNKIMQNEMYAEMVSFSTAENSSATMDHSDDLLVKLIIHETYLRRGRAILPDQEFYSDSTDIVINFEDNDDIHVLGLSNGKINYDLYSFIEEEMSFRVVLPNTTKNNQSVDTTITVGQMSQGSTTGAINLSGSLTELDANSIPVIYKGYIVSSGEWVDFDFSDEVNYNSTIYNSDLTVDFAQGFFASDTITVDDNIFENEMETMEGFEGGFELTNPSITIDYTNSYGLPIVLDLDFTGVYEGQNDVGLNLPPLYLGYPLQASDDPVSGSITYNKDNVPEIVNFLRFPPADLISARGNSISNPAGPPAQENFISNKSRIVVGMKMVLPLELKSENIILNKVVSNGLYKGDEENSDEGNSGSGGFEYSIEKATLAYKIKNGFPMDLDFSLILYDSVSLVRYDTINISKFIAATVDSKGIVTEAREFTGTTIITEPIYENMVNHANSFILYGAINTTKNNSGVAQPVKILTTYSIDFKIGLGAKFSIKTTNQD